MVCIYEDESNTSQVCNVLRKPKHIYEILIILIMSQDWNYDIHRQTGRWRGRQTERQKDGWMEEWMEREGEGREGGR